MKYLLLLSISLLSLTAFAQNKIYIGFSFSPDYSFRDLKNGDGSIGSDLTIKSRNNSEQEKFGYTTSLRLGFHLSENLSLETGVGYANKGYRTKEQNIIIINPDPNAPLKYQSNITYEYLGIPLKAKLNFGKENLSFIAGAGLVTNFLMNAKTSSKLTYSDGKTKRVKESFTKDLNKIDFTPEVSFGIVFKLSNKFNFSAEPTFRYSLMKIKDAPVEEKLWNAGLTLCITYDLK